MGRHSAGGSKGETDRQRERETEREKTKHTHTHTAHTTQTHAHVAGGDVANEVAVVDIGGSSRQLHVERLDAAAAAVGQTLVVQTGEAALLSSEIERVNGWVGVSRRKGVY